MRHCWSTEKCRCGCPPPSPVPELSDASGNISKPLSIGTVRIDATPPILVEVKPVQEKDRTLGGGSVILGTGNADILIFFKLLEKFDYSGPFIMQAYRDDEGLLIFKDQLNWIQSFF